MPLSEQFEQINRQLAGHLEGVVDELRRTYLERLRSAHENALRGLDDIRPQMPSSPVSAETLTALAAALAPPPAPAPPLPAAPKPAAAELLPALRRIDGARMQSELLEGLLEGARGFCGRSALFVTSKGGTRGWAAAGFGAGLLAIDDLSPDMAIGSAMDRVLSGQGVVALDAEQCAALAVGLADEPALDGALVPLVLRDCLAAALYVDRTAGEAPTDLAAVQILCYCAAQALELLALRERSATPTLFVADEEAGLAPLPLWSGTVAPDSAAAVAIEQSAVDLTAAPVAPWEAAPEVEELPEPEPAGDSVADRFAFEPAPLEGVAAPEEPAVAEGTLEGAAEPAPVFMSSPSGEPSFEVVPAIEPVSTWEPAEDDTAVASVPVAEAGESWGEPVFELAPEEEQVFELAPEELPSAEAEPAPEPAVPVEPAPPMPAPAALPSTGFERPAAETTAPLPVQPFPWSNAAATQRIPVAPAPTVRADLSEDETVMIPRSGLPPAAAPSPFATGPTPVPAPPAPSLAGGWPASDRAAGGRGSEVAPPPDLQGPGWAFSGARAAVTSGDEALHEEARRLARLLVSEIKLYNEEQVEEGRRHKDIYPRLRDDIDRSRQLYDERVHERVRATTDYFQQELVRNLAGGDPSALGR